MLVDGTIVACCCDGSCPDPYTGACEWQSGNITVTIPNPCGGGTVQATVCFCFPNPAGTISPKQQIDITSVTLVPASPCPLDVVSMRELKRKVLQQHLTSTGFCQGVPPCSEWCADNPDCFCPSSAPSWEIFSGPCMKPDYVSFPGQVVYQACGPGACGSIFEVCCNSSNGVPTLRWLASDGLPCHSGGQTNCFVVCNVDDESGIGCKLADGTPVPCCCGGDCPDPDTGECPEDGPLCPDKNGYLVLNRCCDGSCPDPVTEECAE